MAKFVYDPALGRMVDAETGELMVPEDGPVALPRLVRPIDGYQSPVDGTWIDDRKQEREHMAKHGVVHTAETKGAPRKLKNERFIKKHGLQHLAE